MRGRQRGNSRFVRRRIDRRVIKKCPKCTKEIPVACKTCPKCKSSVKPIKDKTEQGEEVQTTVLRRTERVRREQPKYVHSVELTSRLKRGTKRKHSVSTSKEVKPSKSSTEEPSESSPELPVNDDKLKEDTDSYKPDRSSIIKPNTLDLDSPKKKRGRPKSVSTQDSDKDKTPSEEDWYCHLPPEKFMQYKVILAEINRKITTQTFKPDD